MITKDQLSEGQDVEIVDKWAREDEPPKFGRIDHVYTNTATVRINGRLELYFFDELKLVDPAAEVLRFTLSLAPSQAGQP